MNNDQLDRLKKLAELRDTGVLTDEEFAEQKAAILGEGVGNHSPSSEGWATWIPGNLTNGEKAARQRTLRALRKVDKISSEEFEQAKAHTMAGDVPEDPGYLNLDQTPDYPRSNAPEPSRLTPITGGVSSGVPRATLADTSALSTWGWWLATLGAFAIPLLALVAIGLGIGIIVKDSARVGTGIGIIVVSIVVVMFSIGFWAAFWPSFCTSSGTC